MVILPLKLLVVDYLKTCTSPLVIPFIGVCHTELSKCEDAVKTPQVSEQHNKEPAADVPYSVINTHCIHAFTHYC